MPADDHSGLPSVLILGGLAQGFATALLVHLIPLAADAEQPMLASHVRICDRHLIVPASKLYLRWVYPEARAVLEEHAGGSVEYMQVNLSNDQSRAKAFSPPSSTGRSAYDIVVDFVTEDSALAGSQVDEVLYEVLPQLRSLPPVYLLLRPTHGRSGSQRWHIYAGSKHARTGVSRPTSSRWTVGFSIL